MSKAYVEIDFFQMEAQKKIAASKLSCPPELAPSSSRGIQSVVSRINPQLLRTAMARGSAAQEKISNNFFTARAACRSSNPSPSPSREPSPSPQLPPPVFISPSPLCSSPAETAPLTIFFNGTVTTFDVSHHKAEAIMRMAEVGRIQSCPAERPEDSVVGVDGKQLTGDLPMARRKSLQLFLTKRRERLAWSSPYHKMLKSGHPC